MSFYTNEYQSKLKTPEQAARISAMPIRLLIRGRPLTHSALAAGNATISLITTNVWLPIRSITQICLKELRHTII